jgi:hexokinase
MYLAFLLIASATVADSVTDTMAELPKELLGEFKRLEELFTVTPTKLKDIARHFTLELGKGISFPHFPR